MSFSTVEDINGAMFDNQGFWWYELDLSLIDPTGDAEFTDVKVDFLTISKEKDEEVVGRWNYTISIDNDLFGGSCYVLDGDGRLNNSGWFINNNVIEGHVSWSISKIYLYMGVERLENGRFAEYLLKYNELYLTLKELENRGEVEIIDIDTGEELVLSRPVELGFNAVLNNSQLLLVKLLKTDFQFDCSQQLTVGEVNIVSLGTLSDYKPNGALVGEYETKISVLYNNKTLPVVWNSQLNDYSFDLDLTDIQSEGKIRFKVIVEANDVLNASETDVALDCKFETIDTLAKLQNLFKIGGIGRVTGNITLTNDLTVTKSVSLIGDNGSINLNGYKIIVASDLTFKADNISFSNGFNSIQQQTGSNVELTDCSFVNCSGFGSIIDCQIDINSLNDEDDFRTILTRCNISNSDMMILHGGHLEINECVITGKVGNKNYPYCLYQADGNASITRTEFSLIDDTVYDYDLLFNPCIFTVGETATINGLGHSDLQRNNVTALLGDVRNNSIVDLTYHYNLIEDTINLKATNGFCHNVSGEDFVFKTNIQLTRG